MITNKNHLTKRCLRTVKITDICSQATGQLSSFDKEVARNPRNSKQRISNRNGEEWRSVNYAARRHDRTLLYFSYRWLWIGNSPKNDWSEWCDTPRINEFREHRLAHCSIIVNTNTVENGININNRNKRTKNPRLIVPAFVAEAPLTYRKELEKSRRHPSHLHENRSVGFHEL